MAANKQDPAKKSWRSQRTSAGVPRVTKNLNVLNKKFVELIPDSLQIVQDVIQPKYELDGEGKQYKVIPDKSQVDLAKWIIDKQIALEKEITASKMRKLELAVKEKIAADSGAIPKEDPQQTAKAFGGPKPLSRVDWSEQEWEDPEEDEEP